jgi:hypothetical protein
MHGPRTVGSTSDELSKVPNQNTGCTGYMRHLKSRVGFHYAHFRSAGAPHSYKGAEERIPDNLLYLSPCLIPPYLS